MDRIQTYLGRYVGKKAAELIILRYCGYRNISIGSLRPEHLPDLGRYMHDNLSMFVGARHARHILRELHNAAIQ